ncbi:hypothetical protein MBLNU459_g1149t1 [Dothideomycetes sp. NU459]
MNGVFSLRCLRSAPPSARPILAQPKTTSIAQQASAFSSTPTNQARKKGGPKKDARINQIRYYLQHPLTPRPLRFSRQRYLRHWTIHRAWQLHRASERRARELELERQYNSMRDACEALRLMDGHGMVVAGGGGGGEAAAQASKDVGRLYRIAMEKKGIWDGVPIEYARIQTEGPSRDGWNHAWTR